MSYLIMRNTTTSETKDHEFFYGVDVCCVSYF